MAAPRWVWRFCRGAALYGVVALAASLLAGPPASVARLTFFAFTVTALAFQFVFWVIGGDPVRYRALLLAGVAEKLAFGLPVLLLFGTPGVPGTMLPFATIDLLLGAGFMLAWRATPR